MAALGIRISPAESWQLLRARLGAFWFLPASFYHLDLSIPKGYWRDVAMYVKQNAHTDVVVVSGAASGADWALGSGERKMLSMRLPKICAFG